MATKNKLPELDSANAVGGTQESIPVGAVAAETGNYHPVKPLEAEDAKCEPAEASGARAGEAAEQQLEEACASTAAASSQPLEAILSRVGVPRTPSKQQLQHRWSLWFYKNDQLRSWEENLMEVTSFQTLEDFSALYGYIEAASNLENGCDYCLFKFGIKPMWEDARNRQGGRWLFNMGRSRRDLDSCWLAILLCLITEEQEFGEFSEDVCGAVVKVRAKADKIAVWTADVRRAEANVAIGRALKERIKMNPSDKVSYHSHADIRAKRSSGPKVRYRV